MDDGPPDVSTAAAAGRPLRVDRRLLEILVCPLTRGPLEYRASENALVSQQANVAYPIRDGIPIMLAEEAAPLVDARPIGLGKS